MAQTMKTVKNLSYPLLLFLLLSLMLHLLAWSGFSGWGDPLLQGLGRISHGDVIDCLITEAAPPETRTESASSVAGQATTHTRPVSADTPSTKAEATQPATSIGAATVDEQPAIPVQDRETAAVETSVPDTPSENAAPASLPPQEQAARTVQSASPTADASRTAAATVASPPPDIIPFERERLTFSLYWTGIHVGTATIEAVRGEVTSSITSVVNSNAVISAFYRVEDRAEARLVKGRPASFTLLQSEGKHRGNKETIFDLERNRVIYINHLADSRQEYDMHDKLLWDVLTGFYYLRRQPLEIGKPVNISMFDSNKFLNTEVKVLRREKVKLNSGEEVSAIVVEPILNSEGLFKKSGTILIWLTDDERRMPVRMETKLKIGWVTAVLKSFSVKNQRD
jgi:hypothetical protein